MTAERFSPATRWAVGLFALVAGAGLLPAQAAAQEPTKPPALEAPKRSDFLTFRLRNVGAAEVAQALQSLMQQNPSIRFVPEVISNTILVSAPEAEMARIKDLINKLDTPRPEGDGGRLSIFSLKSIEPNQALKEALGMVFRGNGNFALDPQRKTVIVYADEKTTSAAEALLSRLEAVAGERTAPATDMQVRVVWLVSGDTDPRASSPPDDLKDVVPTLAKMGIDKPRLAAQVLVNVKPGSKFETQGVGQLGQFRVSGRLSDTKETPELQIVIRATRGTPAVNPEELCNLSTEISAPPGHLVVLGMTPTGTMTSVFVVQVLRPDAKRSGPGK